MEVYKTTEIDSAKTILLYKRYYISFVFRFFFYSSMLLSLISFLFFFFYLFCLLSYSLDTLIQFLGKYLHFEHIEVYNDQYF